MTGIVYHHLSVLKLFLNFRSHIRITDLSTGIIFFVSIEVYLVYKKFGVIRFYRFCKLVGLIHMQVRISVVRHKGYVILPGSGRFIFHVRDALIYCSGCLSNCSYGETPNADIQLIGR